MIKFYKAKCESDDESEQQFSNLKDQVWQYELNNRRILINEDIGSNLIEKAVLQVYNINNFDSEQEEALKNYTREPIIIYINTNGGTMDEAFSLISAIETSQTPIVTIALGKAWSAGFLILIAGHKRYAQKYSSLMLHQGSAGVAGEFKRMIEYTDFYQKCHDIMAEYIMKKTKIKKKKIDEIFHGKTDLYMSSNEAIELGVIDEIV